MKVVFWVSAVFILYTYAGYPTWLWLRSLWRRRPVQRASCTPTVSIVMVVRNEERFVQRKLENLSALHYPHDRTQLIVVSDGSTDGTESILHRYAENPRMTVVLNQLPLGKARGLNDASELAQGEVIVFTDARQTIEPDALALLLENFADPQIGCASGELALGDPISGESVAGVGLYWCVEKQIRQWESAAGSVVGATGAFYAVRRELATPLPPATILDDVYLPMQVARQGYRVVFDSRARVWDVAEADRSHEFARKVRTLSGNYQLLRLAPWLLTAKNPLRFEFVSHKLLRLLAPFALATVLLASAAASGSIYRWALGLQAAFYGFGILGMLHMKRGPVARLADGALTFVVLNTAALVAFAKFLTGRKTVWVR